MAEMSLLYKLLGRDESASKTLKEVGHQAEETGGAIDGIKEHFGGLKSALAQGLSFAVAAKGMEVLSDVVHDGFEKVKNQAAAMSQLEAGVKSTGDASGLTADQMAKLSEEVQNYSGQTQESIEKGEGLLLTFTNIRDAAGKGNDVFTQATKLTADMAQRMGTDAPTAAMQLGKALNDPIKGVGALRKVGVQLDDAQQKNIKTMMAHGNTMGAQKVILGELNKEFGGSAKAFGDTMPGQLAKSKLAFEDLSGKLVGAFLPILTALMGMLSGLAEQVLPPVEAFIDKIAEGIKQLIEGFGNTKKHGDEASGTLATIGHVLGQVAGVVGIVLKAFASGAWAGIKMAFEGISAALKPLFHWLGEVLPPAIDALSKFFDHHKAVLQAVGAVVGTFVAGWLAYKGAMEIASGVTKAFTAVQAALNAVLDANPVMLVILALAALAVGFVMLYKHSATFRKICQEAFQAVGAAASWLWNNAIKPAWDFIKKAFDVVADAAKWLWNNALKPVFGFISDAVGILWKVIKFAFVAIAIWFTWPILAIITLWEKCAWFRDGVKAVVGFVLGFFADLGKGIAAVAQFLWGIFTKVAGFVWDYFYKPILQAIGWILGKFWDFLTFMGGLAGKVLGFLWDLAKDIMKPFVDAGKWLFDIGKHIVEGLINGLKSAASWLGNAILSIIPGPIKGIVKSALGIHSPSTVFHEFGQNIVAGLVNGLSSSSGDITDQMTKMTDGIKAAGPKLSASLGDVAANATLNLAAGALPAAAAAAPITPRTPTTSAAAGDTHVHIHLAGQLVGTKRELARTVQDALLAHKNANGGKALGLA